MNASTARVVSSFALAATAGLAVAATAIAQTRLPAGVTNRQGAVPEKHRSYVRDANGKLVATDRQYVQDIRDNWPGENKTVDAVFQQCYGGGMVARFEADAGAGPAAKRIARYTAASAAKFDQPADNKVTFNGVLNMGVVGPPYTFIGVDNFTRAWSEDARRNPLTFTNPINGRVLFINGFYRYALTGAAGRSAQPILGVLRVMKPAVNSDGQFYSPDPDVPHLLAGENNHRTPQHTAEAPVYAVLVAWSSFNDAIVEDVAAPRGEARFAGNLTRVYRTLRDNFGVPAANIAVLYRNGARGDFMPAFTSLRPNDDDGKAFDLRSFTTKTNPNGRGVFIDGPNDRATWLRALQGRIFSQAPAAGARLVLYNTGHGGKGEIDGIKRDFGRVGALAYDTSANAIDKSAVPAYRPGETPGEIVANLGGAYDEVTMQVSTSRSLPPGVQVLVDGSPASGSLVEVASGAELELGEFAPEPGLHHYRMTFDSALLDAALAGVRVEFVGAGDDDPGNTLVRAIVLRAGEAEYLGTVALPLCAADFNSDGELNADDLSDFITAYFSIPANRRCDFDGSGDVTPDDMADYVTAYFSGC